MDLYDYDDYETYLKLAPVHALVEISATLTEILDVLKDIRTEMRQGLRKRR